MRNMKRSFAVLAATVMAVCGIALTGCQQKLEPADQVVGALYELSVKENAAPMKDLLGFASEEDVKTTLMEDSAETDLVSMFKSEFEAAGIEFSDEEVAEMSDALQGLIDKLDYSAEITDQSKDETTVLLKVKSYSMDDMQNIMVDVMTDMQNNIDEETAAAIMAGDEDALQKLMQDAVKQYMAKIGEMEPAEEMTELTIKCQRVKVDVSGKEKIAWMPQDLSKFSDEVNNATFK